MNKKEVVKGKNLFDEEKIIDTEMKEPLFVSIPFDEYRKLQEEIDSLIKENHKHIDYIADMKKKHEDKIRTKIKELEEKYKKYEKEGLYGFADKLDIGTRIDVLKELLGDDE